MRVRTSKSIGPKAWALSASMLLVFTTVSLPASADRFPEAADYLRQSLENLFAQGEKEAKAGNYSAAVSTFQKARVAAAQRKDEQVQVDCLMKLGEIFWNLGDLDKSETSYKEAGIVAARICYAEAISRSRLALDVLRCYQDGKKYCNSYQYQRSIDNFLRGIQLSRKLGCPGHEAKCLRRMSVAYYEQNKMEEFLELNQRALLIYQKIRNEREIGYCLYNIGVSYEKQLELPLALQYMFEALKIAQKQNIQSDKIDCLLGVGYVYSDLGNFSKATSYFSEATKLIKNNRDYANVPYYLCNLGSLYRRKAEIANDKSYLNKALDCYYEALEFSWQAGDRRIEAKIICNISFALLKLNEIAGAMHFLDSGLQKAILLNDPDVMSQMLINKGHSFLELGHPDKAIIFFKRALDLSSKNKTEYWLWEAYWGLGKCLEKRNELSAAESSYRNSIALIERTRDRFNLETDKASFVQDKLAAYESLAHLLFMQLKIKPNNNLKEKTFAVIEKAKAHSFLENIRGGRRNIIERISPELRANEEEISGRISNLMRAVSRQGLSGGQKESLWRDLAHWEEKYDLLMDRVWPVESRIFRSEPLALNRVQAFLRERKTAVLEYLLGDEQSYLVLLTGKACDIWSLPPKSEIENSIKIYIKMLSSPPRGEFRGKLAARRLFRELLFPLKHVEGMEIENLVIVPDGLLYYLPFETLTDDSSERSALDRCLLEDYSISYAPSVTSLYWISESKRAKEAAKGLLAFGNPNYDNPLDQTTGSGSPAGILRSIYLDQGFSFFPLPHTQEEVLDISRFFMRDKADVFLGEQASEEAVKKACLTDYRIIHFACHGFLDERFPLRSALVLSPTKVPNEDGFLQAREVNNLRTQADLIVLSACQTGKGSLEKGEGLLGLTRVFFYVGAKSVVSALWPINDQSTSVIMQYFYAGLARGLGKSRALREAKLKMTRSEYAHPFYWAAFILNGDYDSGVNFH